MAYLSTDPLAGGSISMNPGQAVDSGSLIDHAPLGPTASTGGATGGGSVPSYVNLQDPVQAAVWQAFQKKGIVPRDQGDFRYWVDHINQSGGLDTGYAAAGGHGTWADRMASASGGVGDYGSGGGGGGGMGAGGISNDPFGQYSQGYHLPTEQEALNMPGLQFAIDQAGRAVQSSAAAKGTLLTGGTLKALSGYTTGTALQGYSNLANLGLGAYNTNYNVWRNNQNDTTNALYNMAQLGKPGA